MIENSTQQNKFDAFVKNSLKEVEVPLDMSGWAKMEQRLDASSGSSSLKGNKMLLGSIAAVVILTASILTYSYWPTGSVEPIAEPTVEQEITPTVPSTTPESSNAVSSSENMKTPESTETSLPLTIEKEEVPVADKKVDDEKADEIKEVAAKEPERRKTEKKTEKNEPANDDELNQENFLDVFNRLKKDQAPSFGDQIVPGKGFTKATEEEERLQREAMKKVRENNNMLMKPDSTHPFGSDTSGIK